MIPAAAVLIDLEPITDDVHRYLIPDGGHILPLDKAAELLEIVVPFLAPDPRD